MPAIITQDLKRLIIDTLMNDLATPGNYYYIGIGKADDWDSSDTPPNPLNSIQNIRETRESLQSIKLVSDYTRVVPRNNWSSGAIYSAWNDAQSGYPSQPYYVITDTNQVYICLRQARDASGNPIVSTVKPTGIAVGDFKTADGYVWKFLFSISAVDASKYLSANFLPVRYIDQLDSDGFGGITSPADVQEQYTIQQAARKGEITGFRVIDGGSGYTGAPTVTIFGDGTQAKATATVNAGVVTKVDMFDSADGRQASGINYTYANAVFTGGAGTGAVAVPIFATPDGIGANPIFDLRSTGIMFNSKPTGDEGGDFIIGNDFRQVSLIKNPKKPITDSDFTDASGIALRNLKLSTVSSPFTPDKTLLGGTSGAKGFINKFDSDQIWYHQTEELGYIQFQEGEPITEIDGNGSGLLDSDVVDADDRAYEFGDINLRSGSVLYVDNRAAVTRTSGQTEDIKIIIQL